jgi:cytoskeletal protein RodZ
MVAEYSLGVCIRGEIMWNRRTAHQLSLEEVVFRARKLNLPDVESLFGPERMPPHEELVRARDGLENLRTQIVNTERERREWRLWIFAAVSTIASAISAVAAWTAVRFSNEGARSLQ